MKIEEETMSPRDGGQLAGEFPLEQTYLNSMIMTNESRLVDRSVIV